uniref:Uncharacterized protein n=1 Tax=Glossina austeni TaxID=7395 RepID=A0A1A9V3S2_GLOAU
MQLRDDVPMKSLESLTFYKLFSKRRCNGFIMPAINLWQGDTSDIRNIICNELPVDWKFMHGAHSLYIMRPGIAFIAKGKIGKEPKVIDFIAVVEDNQEFDAMGCSRKMARRNVAAIAYNTLFGTNLEEEREKIKEQSVEF